MMMRGMTMMLKMKRKKRMKRILTGRERNEGRLEQVLLLMQKQVSVVF